MNDSKYEPTLCVGADVHLDEIVLRAVDKALGHEVLQRFRVTNNLPGAQRAAATIVQTAMDLDYARIEIGWAFLACYGAARPIVYREEIFIRRDPPPRPEDHLVLGEPHQWAVDRKKRSEDDVSQNVVARQEGPLDYHPSP